MTTGATRVAEGAKPPKTLQVALWVVQALLFVTFAGGGLWKLFTPIPEMASKMPWTGQVAPAFLYFTGVVDLCGGLGLLLPSLTRIKPRLTVYAAVGCLLLQASAIVFHVSRGEADHTPFNFFLVALLGFVLWGRAVKAPIPART
jgi:hypothetical protein